MRQKTVQRISMRLYKNPVKHDGDLVEFAPDGSKFKVHFDGPLADMVFWHYDDDLVIDKDPETSDGCNRPPGSRIWQVL